MMSIIILKYEIDDCFKSPNVSLDSDFEDKKWWTLESAYRLEIDHLRAVIDASLSLMKAGQV